MHSSRHSSSSPSGPNQKDESQIHQMIRVNQAGEYGAKCIYEGQLSILKNHPCAPLLHEMKAQELEHLKAFEQLMIEKHVRPTVLSPVWTIAGYGLGVATALLGEKAAMACTVAVEEVIDDHYARQEVSLKNKPQHKALRSLIQRCRQDEERHKEKGLAYGAEEAPAYPFLSWCIKAASRGAIWMSKRM